MTARRWRGCSTRPAILTRFSRLVIDPNRGEDDPTLVMRLYDGTIIPANRHVGARRGGAAARRLHRPYHAAIAAAIDAMIAAAATPALVAIHSFTPQLRGRAAAALAGRRALAPRRPASRCR